MNTKCDIEWYIHNKSERIKIACQSEAGLHKLDLGNFEHVVIAQLRAQADEYDDRYGTGGFMRFLAKIVYECRKNYDKLELLSKPIFTQSPHHLVFNNENLALAPSSILKPIMTKTCLQCGKAKDPDEFYNNKNMHGGKDSSCKDCRRKAVEQKKNGVPKLVAKNATRSTPEVAFTNEDIDFLIAQCQLKLEEAKNQADFWGKEFIRQTELIQKLERRKH